MALERLRLINDVVIGHELRYFSPELKLDAPIHAFETESTHHLLTQRFSVVIGRIDATITAVIAPPEIAARMGVTATTPLLVRVHTIFAKDGTAVVSGSANYLPPYAFRYSAAPAPVSSLPLNP